MDSTKRLVAVVALVLVAVLCGDASARAPEGVSPGAIDEIAEIEGRCPSFSWALVPEAEYYQLVGYRWPEGTAPSSVDIDQAQEVFYTEVPGTATSWTPSLAQRLEPGGSYVWFVRAVFRAEGGEVAEASEWSEGRFFAVVPSIQEVEEALNVLRRYAGAGGTAPFEAEEAVQETDRSPTAKMGMRIPRGDRPVGSRSMTAANAAIKGSLSDTTGETYGAVGISNSPNGAGLGAANFNGGPDLVLDGNADGQPDAIISQSGIDRPSPTAVWFSLTNSDAGMLNFDVEGKIVGSALVVSDAADLTGATITGGTYSSGSFSGTHAGDGSGLTDLDAGSITTSRLAGARLPEHSPWDCRWYVSASDSQNVTSNCADDRYLVSGFCYTSDTSCGVAWYRPLGLQDLTTGIHLPSVGTGMYCAFGGTCDDVGEPNKAIALCCSTY